MVGYQEVEYPKLTWWKCKFEELEGVDRNREGAPKQGPGGEIGRRTSLKRKKEKHLVVSSNLIPGTKLL